MSAKWRMVLWFTLMMLLLAGVTLTFVLVMNGSVIANPTSQVVKEVSRRADDIEFDNGTFDWDDMKEYKHGVYCTYYDAGGTYLRGAMPFAEAVAAAPDGRGAPLLRGREGLARIRFLC